MGAGRSVSLVECLNAVIYKIAMGRPQGSFITNARRSHGPFSMGVARY